MLEAMWMKGSLRLAGLVAGARGQLLAASCPPFPSPPPPRSDAPCGAQDPWDNSGLLPSGKAQEAERDKPHTIEGPPGLMRCAAFSAESPPTDFLALGPDLLQ